MLLKGKKIRKNRFMALKLDISNACDRVEWDFLKTIMLKLDFNSNWVNVAPNMWRGMAKDKIKNQF